MPLKTLGQPDPFELERVKNKDRSKAAPADLGSLNFDDLIAEPEAQSALQSAPLEATQEIEQAQPFQSDQDRVAAVGASLEKQRQQKVREADAADMTEIGKGFRAGTAETLGLFGAAKAAAGSLIGDDEMFASGMQYYQERMKEAEAFAGDVDELEEIDLFDEGGIGRTGDYLAYTFGRVLPSILTSVAGGGITGAAGLAAGKLIAKESAEGFAKELVEKKVKDQAEQEANEFLAAAIREDLESTLAKEAGRRYADNVARRTAQRAGIAGSYATSTTLNTGETFAKIYEREGVEAPGTALAAGMISGALDTFATPSRVIKKAFPDKFDLYKKDVADQLADESYGKIAKEVLGEAIDIGSIEAGTEAAQEIISDLAADFVNRNFTDNEKVQYLNILTTEEGRSRIYNAAAAGAIGGFSVGGAATGVREGVDARDRSQALAQEEEQRLARMEQFREDAAVSLEEKKASVDRPMMGPMPMRVGFDIEFEGDLSPTETPVFDRINKINQAAGTESTQVEGEDTFPSQSFGGSSKLVRQIQNSAGPQVSGTVLPSVGEVFPSQQINDNQGSALVANIYLDLVERGMPVQFLDGVSGLHIFDSSHNLDETAEAASFPVSKTIAFKKDVVDQAVNDPRMAKRLAANFAHEAWHQADNQMSYSDNLSELEMTRADPDGDIFNVRFGAVVDEIFTNWEQGTETGKKFGYPLNDFYDSLTDAKTPEAQDKIIRSTKREIFAQLGSAFLAAPGKLKKDAPLAYNLIKSIRDNPTGEFTEAQDVNSTDQTIAETPSAAGVLPEVRAPPVQGSIEVLDGDGVGVDGTTSVGQEPASGQLGEQVPVEDGDIAGRLLPQQQRILDVINTDQGLTPTDIATAIDEDLDTVTSLLDQLETDNQVQTELNEDGPLYFTEDTPELARRTADPAPTPDTQTGLDQLQKEDSANYNEAKVRTLSQLQERIPLDERIAGPYEKGKPLTTLSGERFSDRDLSTRGNGLDIDQETLNKLLDDAITQTDTNEQGQVGSLARETVERLEINANTVEFWDRSLKLSDNARYWYEVSAESMREVLPDLSDSEIKQFISVVAATSPVANPFVNMQRALASYANYLQGKPLDNDLVIQKGVTDALKTSDLEGLKTGSFGGTMQLVLGMSEPTLSTNDRQVAATFNTNGEEIGKNPILYEVMSRFYLGLRDTLNANLPEGAQPFETWQLQALGWVEQRYKNEYIKDQVAEGMSEEEALAAYFETTMEEVAGGTNDVDDYSMSLLRVDDSGRRDRQGAIQLLKDAGIDVPGNKITKEILLDPRVPAALSPTTKVFREKRIITAEINSLRNETGTSARAVYDAAVAEGKTSIADQYHGIFATLLNKSSQGKTNPFTSYFKALGLPSVDAKPTRVAVPTKDFPLTVGGSYEGDISPNIRVPVPESITPEQLNIVMTSLSKQWDQDAVPAAHVIDIVDGLREGYTETSQVFVETLEALSREQIEAFAAALPEGSEINFTRFPNGYEFNVFTFDQETFDPATPNPQDVGSAAKAILSVSDEGISNIEVIDAQFQPAGYSEIDNYDDVFAEFNESLYTEQAQGLVGKVQRKIDGRLKDLTEKQIVKELRRKSPSELLNGQSRSRVQRANGLIKQRLSDFKQAEGIAQELASSRDQKLKLFTQKNSGKVTLQAEPVPEQETTDQSTDEVGEYVKKTYDDTQPSQSYNLKDQAVVLNDLQRKTESLPFYKSLVDRYANFKELERRIAANMGMDKLPAGMSFYDQENLMHGKVANDLSNLEKDYIEPIAKLAEAAGVNAEAVGLYLLAKHAPERNTVIAEKNRKLREKQVAAAEKAEDQAGLKVYAETPIPFQDGGSGITNAQARGILAQAEKDGLTPQMEEIAGKVYQMLGEFRQRMVDQRLLDEDSKLDWESTYQFYVPLKGFAAEPDEQGNYQSSDKTRGFSITGSESLKAMGRKSLPQNPLLVSFMDVEAKMVRGRKNEVANTLYDLLREADKAVGGNDKHKAWTIWTTKNRPDSQFDPNKKMTLQEMKRATRTVPSSDGKQISQPRFMQVKRGGQTYFIDFTDDGLNASVHTLGEQAFSSLTGIFKAGARFFGAFQNIRRNFFINYNPLFMLTNPIKDIEASTIYLWSESEAAGSRTSGESLASNVNKGLLAAGKAYARHERRQEGKSAKDKEYDTYTKEYFEDGAPTGLTLTRSYDEQIRRINSIVGKGALMKRVKALGDSVELANQVSENMIRLSAYVEARKAGAERQDAATLAKDITVNFNRKGEQSAGINLGYLFFNAAIQGNTNIFQAIGRKGVKGKAAAVGILGIGYALAEMNILLSGEDDDGELNYQNYNEHELKRTINILPFEDSTGVAFPMAYGYGFFLNIGRYIAELRHGIKDEMEVATAFTQNIVDHFSPVSLSAGDDYIQEARGLAPDIAEFAGDYAINRNFFGGPIKYEQLPMGAQKADSYASKRATNANVKLITEWLNDATGGSEYQSKDDARRGDFVLDWSPDRIDYTINYFLGGLGRFGGQLSDVATKIALDPEDIRPLEDVPFLSLFYKKPGEYKDRMEFYQNSQTMKNVIAELNSNAARGDAELEAFLAKERPLIDLDVDHKGILQALAAYRQTRNFVEKENADVVAVRKRKDEIEVEENKLFDDFNRKFRAALKERDAN